MAMNPKLLRPRASGFNPKSISGLVGWWDASASSSITLNGSNVSSWANLSGTTLPFTQGTALEQPAYTSAGINGRNALTFSGSQGMATASVAGYTQWSAFAAIRPTSVSGTGLPFNHDGYGGTRGPQFLRRNGTAFESLGHAIGNSAFTDISGTTIATNTNYIVSAIQGVTTLEAFVGSSTNGATTNKTQQAYTATPLKISDSSTRFAGLIGEIIWYSRDLSASEQLTVRRYLATKWGVTL